MILLYTTMPSHAEAVQLAEDLVNRKLVACVNIMPNITAIYEWEGRATQEEEVALIIKTAAEKADNVMMDVKRLHPYDTPALIQLKAEKVEEAYLQWVRG